MELDRQVIERRDFPIVRRGYDPASVDAHLRALAADVEELQREVSSRGGESLAASAATQVQGILEAAQATAESIEYQAAEQARQVREAADTDARRTREEAVARAREHVTAVARATEGLLGHVGSLDAETRALVESLRNGAGRLASDLSSVEGEMEALYDAAAGRARLATPAQPTVAAGYGEADQPVPVPPAAAGYGDPGLPAREPPAEPHSEPFPETLAESHAGMQGDPYAQAPFEARRGEPWPEPAPEPAPATPEAYPSAPALGEQALFSPEPAANDAAAANETASANDDLDGARLVALNMALNGDSREDTGRYLAENFEIAEPERLLDEVYTAIEG